MSLCHFFFAFLDGDFAVVLESGGADASTFDSGGVGSSGSAFG